MRLRSYIISFAALFFAVVAFGATRDEARAFKNASNVFSDKIYFNAERDFAAFVEKFPNSEYRSEAILFEAKARFFQTNYTGALELLNRELPQAGALLDQYHFWMGEIHFARGAFEAAAQSYRQLLSSVRQSPLRLEASYNEALSLSKLDKWQQVIDLLSKTDGDFQSAAKARLDSEFVLNGNLLLAEAYAARNSYSGAEAVLLSLRERSLTPLNQWRRDFLGVKVLLAQSRLEGALQSSTNLVQLAARVGQQAKLGESVALQAEILERLNRLPQAIETYEKNLIEGLPADVRRHAVYKSVQLTLQLGRTAEATRKLQLFIEQNPRDPAVDVAMLTLGELQLRRQFDLIDSPTNAATVVQTNWILDAFTNFTSLQSNFPQSQLAGKARLDLGWCYWLQKQYSDAETNFADAAIALPESEDKAIAIFKQADCQFLRGDYTNAAINYEKIVEDFSRIETVRRVLLDQTLYQIVRAGVALNNRSMAEKAAAKILELYPNSFFADRGLLLFGQGLNQQGKPADARNVFTNLVQRFPDSPLRAEAELAIARTYVQDKQWKQAIAQFSDWETKYTNHTLVPDAKFSRALAYAQEGEETNALVLLTNLVASFPSNSLAARAENWLGDYYFNAQEYPKAELHYQEVLKHNPPADLSYQAYLLAGRAAFERQDYAEARKNYFEPLINNTNTPPDLLGQALYALGDTIYGEFLASTNKLDQTLAEATSALNKAIAIDTNAPLAARAWGRLGDFHLQSALLKTNVADFVAAKQAYARATSASTADASCRNQARVGFGRVCEYEGDVAAALDAYEAVINSASDEPGDPIWIKEAGISAGKILETRQDWLAANAIYERLAKMPALAAIRPTLLKKASATKAAADGIITTK